MNKIKQKEICENCKKRNNCNHRELIHKDGCSVHDCDYYSQVVLNEENQIEIEEMAKLMCEEYGNMCGECPCTDCANELHAQRLHNAGYRNCKDKVVLSKEELNTLIGNIEKSSEIKAEELEKVRKETAREILSKVDYESNGQTKQITDLLRKQYGVEVE